RFYSLQVVIYVFYAGRCLRRAHPPEWLPGSFSGTPPFEEPPDEHCLRPCHDGRIVLAQIQICVNIACELLFHHFRIVWSYGVEGRTGLRLDVYRLVEEHAVALPRTSCGPAPYHGIWQ